ncbi:MAG: hypothetical protein EBT09_07185, partial [Actinobacteria bacterium]|nr:hypothetical protein [Actinomycetota bacterium]
MGGDLQFTNLVAGRGHTCGLVGSGKAYCWGSRESGQLGDGTVGYQVAPSLVAGQLSLIGTQTATAAASGTSTPVATPTSTSNASPTSTTTLNPTSTSTASPTSDRAVFTTLTGGGFHTCGLTATGRAYCWG